MSTTSLGAVAICETLIADVIKYQTLDPPVGGGVSNPLSVGLQCAGFDIGAVGAQAAGGVFCDTLHYTTLDPVINPGLSNPLTADLTCTGFSVLDAINMTSGSATISTTLSCNTLNGVFGTLEQLDVVATTGTGSGNITCGGEVNANRLFAGSGGCEIVNGDLTINGGRANLNGGFNVPLGPAQNVCANKMHFTNEVKETGLEFGTVGSPITLAAAGNPGYQVFALPADVYVMDLVCYPALGSLPFDITTTLGSVLTDYVIETTAYCIDAAGDPVSPTFNSVAYGPALVTPAGSNIGVFIVFEDIDVAGTQKFRVRVKLSYPS